MALHIRDPEADRMLRDFASRRNLGLTEALKVAVQDADKTLSLAERIKPIQDRVASYPKTGLKADKAFYDSLNDE